MEEVLKVLAKEAAKKLAKEAAKAATEEAVDYISRKGVSGTIEDVSNFTSKILGSDDSKHRMALTESDDATYISDDLDIDDDLDISKEWEIALNKIDSELYACNFEKAKKILDDLYNSNDLAIDFDYCYIVLQITYKYIEIGNFEGYDSEKIGEFAWNRKLEALHLAHNSDDRKKVLELSNIHDNAHLLGYKDIETLDESSDNNLDCKISSNETEYIEEYKVCLADGGEILDKERRLLDRLALSLGISQERVKELEEQCTKQTLSTEENEYLEEYKSCLADGGEISDRERRLLDKLSLSLGISQERVQEIELQCTELILSTEEKEYLEEYRTCIEESGNISEKERRLLDKLAKSLGLTQETVNRLELSIKQ